MTAPCPDCGGKGYSYSDPDHRQIVCTSCDGPKDIKEEKVSETKKGPFDLALEILEQEKRDISKGFERLGREGERQKCMEEILAATRVLGEYPKWAKLIEAAGKVDKETILGEFDNLVSSCHGGFVPTDEEFRACFKGCKEGIRIVRALLESLPDEEEK
jgi:hypothetical protein